MLFRSDPYRVWISEIMLQQTRVDTVIPYYERFLKSFPNVKALARAEVDEVLRHWSGLGYYQRARQLHRAAKMVVEQCNGKIPSDKEKIRMLPGIGAYTAGAILSIAFGKPEPIVDGNVIRVLTRLQAMSGNPKTEPTQTRLWKEAEKWVKQGEPGTVNQALMELGAMVCSPQNPSCLICPLMKECKAYKQGAVEKYPELPERKKAKNVQISAALITSKGRLLFVRRAARRHLESMWEFPQVEGGLRPLQKLLQLSGALRPLKAVRHSIMDRKIECTPFLCPENSKVKKVKEYTEWKWVTLTDLERFPTSSLNKKILKCYIETVSPGITPFSV